MCIRDSDPSYQNVLEELQSRMKAHMDLVNDHFDACTYYRDHWTRDRLILKTATLHTDLKLD